MDNFYNTNEAMPTVGIPYDDMNWYDIEGNPFGIASQFNAIVFNHANNIVDVHGAMAVGGDFYSPRGFSVGFERDDLPANIEYSPDLVRFLAGGNVVMDGPLVVVGHVVVGGNFRAANGSTYLIGKDDSNNQVEELEYLYAANGGSRYWSPSDKGDHYLIPSYDVPRYIPDDRIGADLSRFFQNARDSIIDYKNCIQDLEATGRVVDNFHEWILQGDDPYQNVFEIDLRPNGLLTKGLRPDVPEGSLVIVKLKTGQKAHLQYGVMGEEQHAFHTLYVFEDANEIFMEVPADIWGSILAPQAMFHGHRTGGHVSGNVALRAFAVNANSGFEFHYYPFVGGVVCGEISPAPPVVMRPIPMPEVPRPAPRPMPEARPIPMPAPEPCPECPDCPEPEPCPTPPPCPVPQPCPEPAPCPPCPTPQPCPECPAPQPCPTPPPCPECPAQQPCPPCPTPKPCPECPDCPKPLPCPECPDCPPCPEQETKTEYVLYPVRMPCPECPKPETKYVPYPIPVPYPEYQDCPVQEPCPECLIKPGIISGCIWGCYCCKTHEWEVRLYKMYNDTKTLIKCEKIVCYGCFEFKVPYEGCYLLMICPVGCNKCFGECKPILSLKNIGVSNFMLE